MNKPGVIIGCNLETGWVVIDKPSQVPVHGTVENIVENAAACLNAALRQWNHGHNNHPSFTVSAPQRLDQNTSGLVVFATRTSFARYFSQILHSKTKRQLHVHNTKENDLPEAVSTRTRWDTAITSSMTNTSSVGAVHKLYRCLVVLGCQPKDMNEQVTAKHSFDDDRLMQTVEQSVQWLRDFATSGRILRHYLEPSIRAPKRFVSQPPPRHSQGNIQNKSNGGDELEWAECLLRIRKVGNEVFYLNQTSALGNKIATEDSYTLGRALWGSVDVIPPKARAVVELEIELLTGRTHQIRGQLSASHFPIVGDVQYGGALITDSGFSPVLEEQELAGENNKNDNRDSGFRPDYYLDSERLALQCCELEFLDPDIIENEANGTITLYASERWDRFRLETAWWTPILKRFKEAPTNLASDKNSDGQGSEDTNEKALVLNGEGTSSRNNKPARPELLPPRVQLSPGRNKYVLIRATHSFDKDPIWFVKSASPDECGGPFHGNVAQDLREWIKAAGYHVDIMGGGRIDLRKNPQTGKNMVIVYGTSHGYGKGDHAKAAALISEWSDGQMEITYDNSEGLY